MTRHHHAGRRLRRGLVLGLVVVAALRVGFWGLLTEAPSPIDEIQHVGYVDSLATHLRPPVIGEDAVPPEMARLAKQAPTFAMRSRPVPADATHPGWGPVGANYEGGQTPLGYLPYVPVWWVVQGLDPAVALLALRVVAGLLALLPVPLLVLAGRRLVPRRPWAGVLAAAIYVLVPATVTHTATVAGDALVPTAGIVGVLAVATVWDRRGDVRSAVYLGAAAAGMLLVKPTTLGAVLVLLPTGFALAAVRLGRRGLARWTAVGAAATVLPLVPWFVWNLLTYGALSGADANDAILGDAQFDVPFGWDALRLHTRTALEAIFAVPRAVVAWDRYELVVLGLLAVAAAAGAVVAARRGRRREAVAVPGLALLLPAAFAGMLVVIFVVFGGRSSVVGRHLLVAVPAACLAIAAGLTTALGRRGAVAVLAAAFGLVLLPREAQLTERFVEVTYLEHAPDGAALALQRDVAALPLPISSVAVDAACPVSHLDVVVDTAEAPPLRVDGRLLQPTLVQSTLRPAWARYHLPVARPSVEAEVVGPLPVVPTTSEGRAAVRAWCPHPRPAAETYAALHDPTHPVPLPYGAVTATTWSLRWLVPALLLCGAAAVVLWPAPGQAGSTSRRNFPV